MKAVACFLLLFFYAHAQNAGDVRLVNGTNTGGPVGRLEIYTGSAWSTVCADDGFCTNVATVVCRQLGFSTINSQAYGLAWYGQGSGTVGYQSFNCSGSELNVTQCTYTTPSTCSHAMDAAVSCIYNTPCAARGSGCCTSGCYISSMACWCDAACHIFNDCCTGIEYTCPASGTWPFSNLPAPSTSCSSIGDISFVAGTSSDGRVYVCDSDYRWKTICSDGFDNNEATVICRSLGFSTSNFTIYPVTQYGQGTQDIYAKNLSCTTSGSESYLTDCPGSDSCCGHHKDVGLACQPACSPGQIRLVGGPNAMEGRVEVCNEGRWGTVCDDFWGVEDARVACKQAGFPWRGAVAYSYPQVVNKYGSGFGPIWFDNLRCTGIENSLFSCPANAVGNHNCVHLEDAGVKCAAGPCEQIGITSTCCDPSARNCQGANGDEVCHCSPDCEEHGDCCIDFSLACRCNDYPLRLRGGTVENEGRVEICYNGVWGTVCDDLWGAPDAKVVCRQLGYTYNLNAAQALSYAYFGAGTGIIWLDNVRCSGTETHLVNCTANPLGSHNCGHYEDASVRCAVAVPDACQHGKARLVRGSNDREGQLEVCYNGRWGTVCDDLFGQVDANVACRTIFPNDPAGGALFIQYSYQYFGYSTLNNIVMDNVQCSGNEPNITSCTHITSHNCYRWEDVGLACYGPGAYNHQPRLIPGPDAGRLQVFRSTLATWTTVCRTNFSIEDARVVCRELGQPTGSPRVYLNLQFNRGYGSTAYILKNVGCTGNETNLNNCSLSFSGYCSHYWDVGIGCQPACSDGTVRLVGGANETEGRIEVCRNGQWGTVCDSPSSRTFAAEEAVVICKQLGLPYTAAQVKSFGAGADPVHISNVNCAGDEGSLSGCAMNTNPSCSHIYDVGITCSESCTNHDVRLVDGSSSSEGRLEICLGGFWGTVCDNQFHNADAKVVCRQLGLPYAGAEAVYDAGFGRGTDHVAITNLYCTGNENSLAECIYQTGSSVSCSHANDAGVICQDVCSDGAIRVAASGLANSGRVEICYFAQWGTVCDKNWDTPDVAVACFQLGYQRTSVRAFGGSKYGAGNGPIFFRDVACAGTEFGLSYCISQTDTSGCTHSDDAGIQCNGDLLPPAATPVGPGVSRPPPDMVTNITFTINSDTSAQVTWSPPETTNGIVTNYTVSIGVVGSGMMPNKTTILGNRARIQTFNALMAGVPYMMNITASNVFGVGDAYSQQFFTRELAPNTMVKITQNRRIDEKTITFSWMPLSLYQARGYVTGYQVSWAEYQEGVTPTWTDAPVGYTTTSWTSPNTLTPSSRYAVTVAAITTGGLGVNNKNLPTTIITTTSSAYFQLKIALNPGQQCGTWSTESSASKLTTIVNKVVVEINKRCQNCFYPALIAEQRFQCNADTAEFDQVTFRARLFAPGGQTNTTILSFINNWVMATTTAGPTVNIDGVDFAVDSSCTTSISGFTDDFCTTSRPTVATGSSGGLAAGAVAGVSLAVIFTVLVAAGIVAIVVVFMLVFTHRSKNKYGENEVVGYSNMAFPEGGDDNISQHMGSTVHDDDFQEALNMISDDIEKTKEAQSEGHVYINQ